MANKLYSLVLQKGTEKKDLVDDFSVVCLEVPMAIQAEIMDFSSTEYYGEDGEDTYFPEESTVKAFDWKVKLGTLAATVSTCVKQFTTFINYLTGKDGEGTELSVYSAWTGVGHNKVYCKQVSEPEFSRDSQGNSIASFEVTFRITNPLDLITL